MIGLPPRTWAMASWKSRAPIATGIGCSPWPYRIPGIRPAARALRAPPLPRPSRREPVSGMTDMMLPPYAGCSGLDARRAARGSDEQRAERTLLVNALHRLAQHARDRQLGDLGGQRGVVVTDGVGDDQLLDRRGDDAVERPGAEHA